MKRRVTFSQNHRKIAVFALFSMLKNYVEQAIAKFYTAVEKELYSQTLKNTKNISPHLLSFFAHTVTFLPPSFSPSL